MNRGLLELLVDPLDGSPLEVEWLEDRPAGAMGLLRGGEGRWYPVVDDIPRVVTGQLREGVIQLVRSRMSAWPGRFPDDDDYSDPLREEVRLLSRTASSFGYEWTTWASLLPAYERNARYYFEALGVDTLEGQRLIDVGCGTGRHAYWASRWGARVVGIDLSAAIETARRNVEADDALFVQADLLNPPFRAQTFDTAVSFGVLHHLPDPSAGLHAVTRLVRVGGRVSIYLYHDFDGRSVKAAGRRAFDAIRQVTTRLPFRAVHLLAYGFGAAFTLAFVVPTRLARRLPGGQDAASSLPFSTYADYPFRVIVNDQFDRFATPLERRYSRTEVERFMRDAELADVRLLEGGGWRAVGTVDTVIAVTDQPGRSRR